ncbi:MAG: SAM-dependent methyltransferase, partial [Lachnospiraceae bacterium]|nr:SAM-dependent methyltransferase [Lachnospiraceae bacterium]
MEELRRVLAEILNKDLGQIILSNSRDASVATKAKIRPVLIGDTLKFQETRYRGTQVFHENYTAEDMALQIEQELQELFRQGEMSAKAMDATVLVSKKGKMTVKTKRKAQAGKDGAATAGSEIQSQGGDVEGLEQLSHNRKKTYLLPEGEPVDFLVHLGVQTPDGRVTKNRYDKFR